MNVQNIICVPFDMIYFLDFGILKVLKEKYFDDRYFESYIYENTDERITYELLSRSNKNPLSIITKENYKDKIDSLYKELLETEYENIIKNSPTTRIKDMIITGKKMMNLLQATIVCKNELEEQIIKNDKDFKRINIDSKYDYKGCDTVFYNDIFDILNNIQNIGGKNVIVSNVKYNLRSYDNKTLTIPEEVDILTADICRISLIDLFTLTDEHFIAG